jgi:hypothetical protein
MKKMKRKVVVVTFFLLFIGLGSTFAHANTLEKRWGIGLGNPYLSMKYHDSARTAYEIRAAFGTGINVYSARFYQNSELKGKSVTFWGLEAGSIAFTKEDIGGSGYFAMLFFGLERFITKKMTLSFDIGPAYISLSSDDISVEGIELVYNLGINFYFN